MLAIIFGILGLMVGSFLNTPRSRCPQCKKTIPFWVNIRVFSYLFLRGKCYSCGNPISIGYPLVELITGILSVLVAIYFGFGWQAFAALILTWALIALTVIDLQHFILPDTITLPMVWLGLLVNAFSIFTTPASAIIGAVAGYLSLYLFAKLYKLIRRTEGMGYGDFKLLAVLGAWLGWQILPLIVLLASFLGAVIGIILILLGDKKKRSLLLAIPFGPFLALAGWIALFWGQNIIAWYL
jgi:leader peptidase (prepilin peptidase)/N-methyltransferase